MRTLLLAGALAACLTFEARPETLALWDFNSPTPDNAANTGSLESAAGAGTLSIIGGVTSTFATGDAQEDPAGTSDNSGLNTSHYPSATLSNRTAGVRLSLDTRGYEAIRVSWRQRNSGSASRYLRCQYAADGLQFTDAALVIAEADSIFVTREVDLSDPACSDNPALAVQLVTEFEETALCFGLPEYLPTKPDANYSAAGTLRFDMLRVSGTRIPDANTPPWISRVSCPTLRVGQSPGQLSFTVGDGEDSPALLTVSASSSDEAVIPSALIQLSGQASERFVTLQAGAAPGTAAVTLTVTDCGGRSSSTDFSILVLPENTAPSITLTGRVQCLAGSSVEIPFHVDDLETPDTLQVSAQTGNPAVLPSSGLQVLGTGTELMLRASPPAGGCGVVPVTLRVSDGGLTTELPFPISVIQSRELLFEESFEYPAGSLVTNSARFWSTRSGEPGETPVRGGELELAGDRTEDIVAAFPPGSCPKGSNLVLYAAFTLKALSLPQVTPGLLAHFGAGSTLRGRVYAGTTNAAAGRFRLFAANGSTNLVEFPRDLATHTTYRVCTRYDVDNACTTLWVDPVAEADIAAEAIDEQTPASISAFGFRQDDDVGGQWIVDDLRVGFSFESVNSHTSLPVRLQLNYRWEGRSVVLHWDDPRALLQLANSPAGPYTTLPSANGRFTPPPTSAGMFFRLTAPR